MVNHICEPISSNQFASCSSARVGQGGDGAPLTIFELMTRDVLAAASVAGLKVQILKASTEREIDTAFASLVQARTGALLVGGDPLFNNRIEQVVALAARHA